MIGTQKVRSCAEAERVQSDEPVGPSHDAFTRQPHRLLPPADRRRAEAGSRPVRQSVLRPGEPQARPVTRAAPVDPLKARSACHNRIGRKTARYPRDRISERGDTVHLKRYGLIRMFRTAGTDDGVEYIGRPMIRG